MYRDIKDILNLVQAEEVRKLYSEGLSQIKLSKLFNVHLCTIQGIINKTTRRLILEGDGSNRLGEVQGTDSTINRL